MLRLTLIFYSYLHLFSDFHQNLESTAKFSQPPPLVHLHQSSQIFIAGKEAGWQANMAKLMVEILHHLVEVLTSKSRVGMGLTFRKCLK